MVDVIYVEEALADHPRVLGILERWPRATVIACGHYGEVFNPRRQDFRLQKEGRPALILARKTGRKVLPAPSGYGIGHQRSFYFSHVLNCLYDCRYCFLQGLYRSAGYVLFVNFEDFEKEIAAEAEAGGEGESCFFSGYDGDSFALEAVTGFAGHFVAWFRDRTGAFLELRTKSLAARRLLDEPALDNVVVAFSVTPEAVSRRWEGGVPPLAQRLRLAAELARSGWRIGWRLDPLIRHRGFETAYRECVEQLAAAVPPGDVHSVSLGTLRFPVHVHRRMRELHPEEPLLAAGLRREGRMVGYGAEHEFAMIATVREALARHFPPERIFSCGADPE